MQVVHNAAFAPDDESSSAQATNRQQGGAYAARFALPDAPCTKYHMLANAVWIHASPSGCMQGVCARPSSNVFNAHCT